MWIHFGYAHKGKVDPIITIEQKQFYFDDVSIGRVSQFIKQSQKW